MSRFFPTRNPADDAREQQRRNAAPLPEPAVMPSHGIAPEVIAFQLDQQRQRERAAEAPVRPASTLADEAVRCLRALLVAAADQEAGRALSPTANQSLGDLSRILATAQARGVGLSSEFSVRAG
jgi:hypothetical protein